MVSFGERCYSNQYDEISDDEFSDDEISGFANTTKFLTTKFLTTKFLATKFPPPCISALSFRSTFCQVADILPKFQLMDQINR